MVFWVFSVDSNLYGVRKIAIFQFPLVLSICIITSPFTCSLLKPNSRKAVFAADLIRKSEHHSFMQMVLNCIISHRYFTLIMQLPETSVDSNWSSNIQLSESDSQ